jgi:hypothetical protein
VKEAKRESTPVAGSLDLDFVFHGNGFVTVELPQVLLPRVLLVDEDLDNSASNWFTLDD